MLKLLLRCEIINMIDEQPMSFVRHLASFTNNF